LNVALPAAFDHRQTFGASLRETKGRAELEGNWSPFKKLTLSAGIGVRAALRPAWPDLYQPGFAPTDRYSYFERGAKVELFGFPLRHQFGRLRYEYSLIDYTNDPNFLAVERPTHLVPFDHDEHRVVAQWRFVGADYKIGLGADAFQRSWFFEFARDAGTGKTHASAGGPPPNPLYVLRGLEPAVSFSVDLFKEALNVAVEYRFELADDVFQGYYSYTAHHPVLRVRLRLPGGAELRARGEANARTYGSHSYTAGPSHAPLSDEERRYDRRAEGSISMHLPLRSGVAIIAEATARMRHTNFPDYPTILWSYNNAWLVVGAELAF